MPLCEGHLCKQMQADAADITTHVPQRGHPNRYNNPICMTLDYNSRPSTRGIISMIAGASPMELLQFSPICDGHLNQFLFTCVPCILQLAPLCEGHQTEGNVDNIAIEITTHAPL